MTGFASSLDGKRGVLLVELVSDGRRPATYAVPGGLLEPDERWTYALSGPSADAEPTTHAVPAALLGAAREWQEEVHGLTGDAARLAGEQLVLDAMADGRVTGTYGDVLASRHAAYVIMLKASADLDDAKRAFVANAEAASAIVISVERLEAGDSKLATASDGRVIHLREKIGHQRVCALRALPLDAPQDWWLARPASATVPEASAAVFPLRHERLPETEAASLQQSLAQRPPCSGTSSGEHVWLRCPSCMLLIESPTFHEVAVCAVCGVERPQPGPFCGGCSDIELSLAATASVAVASAGIMLPSTCPGSHDGMHKWLQCPSCLLLVESSTFAGHATCAVCALIIWIGDPFCGGCSDTELPLASVTNNDGAPASGPQVVAASPPQLPRCNMMTCRATPAPQDIERLIPCDYCQWGHQTPGCDNEPATCDAWTCSEGSPPCPIGMNHSCFCNDGAEVAARTALSDAASPPRPPRRKTVTFSDDVTIVEFAINPPTPVTEARQAASWTHAWTEDWRRRYPSAATLDERPGESWLQAMLYWVDAGSGTQVWFMDANGQWHDDREDRQAHAALPMYLLMRAICSEWRTEVAYFNPRVAFLGRLEQYFIGRRTQHRMESRRLAQHSAHAIASADVWVPKATSIANRATADTASTPLAALSSRTRGHTIRYSDSPFLAPSLGQYLSAATVGKPKPVTNVTNRNVPATAPPALHRSQSSTTLYDGEYMLPLPDDFNWPSITHFALYEHVGNMRESWRARGYTSASVADRPCILPPSPGCFHFIGQVYDFISALPYSIFFQSSHVECGPASWSSHKTWPAKILDGRMLEAGEELLYVASIGLHSLAEQPHTAHEHTLGPPSQIINANEHGGANKTWCLWARNVGFIEPSNMVPPEQQHEALSAAAGSPQQKMMLRSPTSREMADAITASVDAQLPALSQLNFSLKQRTLLARSTRSGGVPSTTTSASSRPRTRRSSQLRYSTPSAPRRALSFCQSHRRQAGRCSSYPSKRGKPSASSWPRYQVTRCKSKARAPFSASASSRSTCTACATPSVTSWSPSRGIAAQ